MFVELIIDWKGGNALTLTVA